MKNILKLSIILFSIVVASCSKDEYIEPQVEKNIDNISGEWDLESINNDKIEGDDVFCQVTFNAIDSTFVIKENLNSSFVSTKTGYFVLESNTISGVYDNSYEQKWSYSYEIISLTANSMIWENTETGLQQLYIKGTSKN